jgi:hypothetical protein
MSNAATQQAWEIVDCYLHVTYGFGTMSRANTSMMEGSEMAEDDKARESRLRRQAKRQGLYLRKSRRRDPRVQYYGTWSLTSRPQPPK